MKRRVRLLRDLGPTKEAADRAALDVAFALTGDLDVAHATLNVPFGVSSSLPTEALSAELVRFSVSEDYFALRRELLSTSTRGG